MRRGFNLYWSVFSSPPDTWLCCSQWSDISFALAAVNEWITRRPLSEGNNNAINASSYAMGSLRNAEIIKALGMFAGVRNDLDKIEITCSSTSQLPVIELEVSLQHHDL